MSEQNLSRIKRSSQAIDNFSFDEDFLVKVTELVRRNSGGTALEFFNPATEDNQDPTSAYSISDLDDTSSPKYYGYLKSDGGWYILKLTGTEARYVKGASGYNWSNRASETYDTFSNTF